MSFFEFLGIVVFLYYLISIILWCVLDSDIELWFKSRWGKPIGEAYDFMQYLHFVGN